MLKVDNLGVSIGELSLGKISLELQRGEYFAILGKSGIGKTVFLESIAGRYSLSSGKVELYGREISKLQPEERNLGFVYQNYELFRHMKVSENIGFPMKLKRVKKRDRLKKIDEMMELLGIEDLKNRYPEELSGGEKQRVAIGRALIMSPELLLLDEPLSALDYSTKESVKGMIKDIHERFSPIVMHVTHDIGEAICFADRIGIMKRGGIEKIFSGEDLKNMKNEEELHEHL